MCNTWLRRWARVTAGVLDIVVLARVRPAPHAFPPWRPSSLATTIVSAVRSSEQSNRVKEKLNKVCSTLDCCAADAQVLCHFPKIHEEWLSKKISALAGSVTIDGKLDKAQIWDTAGQERFT
ncbi:hypothetical protein SUGI_0056600 [Cryptomeria japonica]|nr:hypothetical protein SUGI_0056600 [Cryptomeria japonica]